MLSVVEPSDANVRILLAVAVVIVASRLFGWLIAKVGQPPVLGEILAGVALGPSALGLAWPEGLDYLFPPEVVDSLRAIAQLGLVMFMFLVGLDLDLAHLRGHGRRALAISHASIVLPVALGGLLGAWLHPRFGGDADPAGFALFIGAAMAITAFPVLARVLQETGLQGSRIGVMAITCAAIDDVTAWCLLAGVVAVVDSTGPAETLTVVALSAAFVVVMLGVVRPALARLAVVPVWASVALALAGAWATEQIGIHAIFGAFMAGAIVPRRPDAVADVKDKLETATLTVLLPVFFVVIGLATRIDMLDSAYMWAVTGLVVVVAVAGKWGGAMLAARATGESWRDAAGIGVLMNTRGLTELVILSVGLELGVIGESMFTVLVLMALVTTLMAAPALAVVMPARLRPAPAAAAASGAAGEPPGGGPPAGAGEGAEEARAAT